MELLSAGGSGQAVRGKPVIEFVGLREMGWLLPAAPWVHSARVGSQWWPCSHGQGGGGRGTWPPVSVGSYFQVQLSLAGSPVHQALLGHQGPRQSDPQPLCSHTAHTGTQPHHPFSPLTSLSPLCCWLSDGPVSLPGTLFPATTSSLCVADSLTSFRSLQMAHFPAKSLLVTSSLSCHGIGHHL